MRSDGLYVDTRSGLAVDIRHGGVPNPPPRAWVPHWRTRAHRSPRCSPPGLTPGGRRGAGGHLGRCRTRWRVHRGRDLAGWRARGHHGRAALARLRQRLGPEDLASPGWPAATHAAHQLDRHREHRVLASETLLASLESLVITNGPFELYIVARRTVDWSVAYRMKAHSVGPENMSGVASLSRDSTLFASASAGLGELKLWKLADGSPVRTSPGCPARSSRLPSRRAGMPSPSRAAGPWGPSRRRMERSCGRIRRPTPSSRGASPTRPMGSSSSPAGSNLRTWIPPRPPRSFTG